MKRSCVSQTSRRDWLNGRSSPSGCACRMGKVSRSVIQSWSWLRGRCSPWRSTDAAAVAPMIWSCATPSMSSGLSRSVSAANPPRPHRLPSADPAVTCLRNPFPTSHGLPGKAAQPPIMGSEAAGFPRSTIHASRSVFAASSFHNSYFIIHNSPRSLRSQRLSPPAPGLPGGSSEAAFVSSSLSGLILFLTGYSLLTTGYCFTIDWETHNA